VSEKIIASLKEQKILSNDEISVMFSNIGILQALNK
jgi:hypothetical protein